MARADPEIASRFRRRLAGVPGLRLAYLFGSRARGGGRPESDYDVAALVRDEDVDDADAWLRTFHRVHGALAGEAPTGAIDLVFLNAAPDVLRHRVLSEGILLFAHSEVERVRFAMRTLRDIQDSASRRAEATRLRIQRLKEGRPPHGRSGDLLEEARRVEGLLGRSRRVPERP